MQSEEFGFITEYVIGFIRKLFNLILKKIVQNVIVGYGLWLASVIMYPSFH
jgi:hypothetical protein